MTFGGENELFDLQNVIDKVLWGRKCAWVEVGRGKEISLLELG